MIAQRTESIQDRFMQHVERIVFDLRRGLPTAIRHGRQLHLAASVEQLDPALCRALAAGEYGPAHLVMSRHRFAHLNTPIEGETAALPLLADDRPQDIVRWSCDPDAVLPTDRLPSAGNEAARAALALARRARLIPAMLVARADGGTVAARIEEQMADGDLLAAGTSDVFAHLRTADTQLRRVSEADVPLDNTGHARFVLFREADGLREHVAVLLGDRAHWRDPVPVRLHSACLTGDLFGSLRCDCGPQLKASLARIAELDGGVLLYLAQEGRGIGLANKLRAYQMQDEGLDTVQADRALGFADDERDYGIAREILDQLDVGRIRLFTNNPAKLAAFENGPVEVIERTGVYGRLTPENNRYLETKARRAGHWLDSLLGALE